MHFSLSRERIFSHFSLFASLKSRNNLLCLFSSRWLRMSDKKFNWDIMSKRKNACETFNKPPSTFTSTYDFSNTEKKTPQIFGKNNFIIHRESITWLRATIIPKFNFYLNDYHSSLVQLQLIFLFEKRFFLLNMKIWRTWDTGQNWLSNAYSRYSLTVIHYRKWVNHLKSVFSAEKQVKQTSHVPD